MVNIKLCHVALRRHIREYRGNWEEKGMVAMKGMRGRQIMFDRQIKGGESSHDEDS